MSLSAQDYVHANATQSQGAQGDAFADLALRPSTALPGLGAPTGTLTAPRSRTVTDRDHGSVHPQVPNASPTRRRSGPRLELHSNVHERLYDAVNARRAASPLAEQRSNRNPLLDPDPAQATSIFKMLRSKPELQHTPDTVLRAWVQLEEVSGNTRCTGCDTSDGCVGSMNLANCKYRSLKVLRS